MIYKIRNFLDCYLPNAFTIALCLTLLVLVLGAIIQQQTPVQMILYWYDGFWGFLTFTLQMSLMLVLGSTIATASAVKRVLERIFVKVDTPLKALYLIMIMSAWATFFNWAVGMIIGPVLTLLMKKRMPHIKSAHLIAASYAMYVIIFPVSISSTTALLVTTSGHFLESQIGIVPFQQTIFAPKAIFTSVISFFALLAFFHFIVVKEKSTGQAVGEVINERKESKAESSGHVFAAKANNSPLLTYLLCFCALLAAFFYVKENKLMIDFNFINFILLFLGMAIYKSPEKYASSFKENISIISGIILQFPLYAGIMAMISDSGLVGTLIQWITNVSTTETFPFWVILSSSVINFFIPANGGQWLITGSLLTTAADNLGVPIGTTINAFNFGTFTSNFLQPFWALPALALSGLKIKDIWSYCLIAFLIFMATTLICFYLLPDSW
ncbi:TIGR00366 family protein [Alkalihalobacillus oceani]|uniref:TIGR00366 family protein n=1 Tax=Halalkalibacter oceani TaxID=1653776 RepID=UPI00203C4028|nr:TIGR00366 family protein [Halalkalibacter oceani]MCM3762987.1 TIGR00366 family protein [Halalkalibacter oceani]